MTKEMLNQKDVPWLEERTILLVESGSKAYGTNLPTSDKDYKGVCIPPVEYLLGLKTFEQYQPSGDNSKRNTSEDTDVSIYSLTKFFKLAMNGNPNVLEILFTDEESIVFCSEDGNKLLLNKELFLTNRISTSFGGYAYQQRKKLERGLGQRKELLEQYGYDTKTFMHSVRLYEMGIECFKTGTMSTRRPNAEELKAIRKGKYQLGEALQLLEKLDKEFHQALETSVLPDKPNMERLEELLIELNLTSLKQELSIG